MIYEERTLNTLKIALNNFYLLAIIVDQNILSV